MQKESQFIDVALPKELQRIITSTILDTSSSKILLSHDSNLVYAVSLQNVRDQQTITFQKFSLSKVDKLQPIIKNYFYIICGNNIAILEIVEGEANKLVLKFVHHYKPFKSIFLREVVENMAELIVFQEQEVSVYQFTRNGKTGYAVYQIQQNKIKNWDRSHMYGSKSYLNPNKKSIVSLKNYTQKTFTVFNLFQLEKNICQFSSCYPIAYIGLCKTEQFCIVLSNLTVINISKPQERHGINWGGEEEEFLKSNSPSLNPMMNPMMNCIPPMQNMQANKVIPPSSSSSLKQTLLVSASFNKNTSSGDLKSNIKISSFLDHLMIENKQKNLVYVFHIKPKKSELLGIYSGQYDWFWASDRKILGVNYNKTQIRLIDCQKISTEPSNKMTRTPEEITNIVEKISHKQPIKEQRSQQLQNIEELNSKTELKKQMKYRQTLIKEDKIVKSEIEKINKQAPIIKHQETISKQHETLQKNIESSKKEPQKEENNIKPIPYERFKPTKIIQRTKTSTSKTLQKSKEIQPINLENPTQKEIILEKQIEEDKKQEKEIFKQDKKIDQNQVIDVLFSNQQACPIMKTKSLGQTNLNETQEIPKSHALIIGKMNFQGIQKNPLNLFSSNINRAKIFNSPQQQQNNLDLYSPFQNPFLKKQPSQKTKKIFSQIFQQKKQQQLQTKNIFKKTEEEEQSAFKGTLDQKQALLKSNSFQKPEQQSQKEINKEVQKQKQKDQIKLVKIEKEQKKIAEIQTVQRQKITIQKEIKSLFQKTTSQLMSELEKISDSQNSNFIKQKAKEEIIKNSQMKIKLFITNSLTNKIEKYFKQALSQCNKSFVGSFQFYKKITQQKIQSLEVHFDNQEKAISEIRSIENMLRFMQQNIKQEGQQTCLYYLAQINKQNQQAASIVQRLEVIHRKLQLQVNDRNKIRVQTKEQLEDIKQILKEKLQRKEQKKKGKLQKNLKEKEKEKEKRKAKGSKKQQILQEFGKMNKKKFRKLSEKLAD